VTLEKRFPNNTDKESYFARQTWFTAEPLLHNEQMNLRLFEKRLMKEPVYENFTSSYEVLKKAGLRVEVHRWLPIVIRRNNGGTKPVKVSDPID